MTTEVTMRFLCAAGPGTGIDYGDEPAQRAAAGEDADVYLSPPDGYRLAELEAARNGGGEAEEPQSRAAVEATVTALAGPGWTVRDGVVHDAAGTPNGYATSMLAEGGAR